MGEVISEIRYGTGTPPPRVEPSDNSVPFLRATDIKDGQVLTDRLPHISRDQPPSMDKCRLEGGELIIVRSGVNTGDCAVVPTALHGAFAAYDLIVNVDTRNTVAEFLSAFLYTEFGSAQIDSVKNRAAQPHINAEEVKALEIPLPPLDVQHRLVAELDAAHAERDRALAKAKRLLDSIDELVLYETGIPTDLAMRKVFSVKRNQLRGQLTPEPHAVIPLEKSVATGCYVADAGQLIRERVTPGKEAPEDLFAWIRIDDLENRPLAVTHMRTEQGIDIGGSLIPVKENDVLVARLGPTLLNAKIVLCPFSQREMVASPEFLVLRANDNWNPTFLRWLLRTNYYRTIMYARSRGGTPSRYRLDALDFLTIPLPRVSLSKQIEIAEHCNDRVQNAQALRIHAEAVWRSARERFEQQLLQGGKA